MGEVYWLRFGENKGTAKAALGHVGLPLGWRYGKLSVGPMSLLLIRFGADAELSRIMNTYKQTGRTIKSRFHSLGFFGCYLLSSGRVSRQSSQGVRWLGDVDADNNTKILLTGESNGTFHFMESIEGEST